MKPLPPPETYEQELVYWPYRESIKTVVQILCAVAQKSAKVLDLMCGPGYLQGQLLQQRPDLSLHGVDIEQSYVEHGMKKYPQAHFEVGDVLTWKPQRKFDVITCTGALHHLPYERQGELIHNMASWLNPSGTAILSDCYIDDYSNELERKLGAAKLGYEYLAATIRNGAPDEVIEACTDIIANDVLKDEFKTSLGKRLPKVKRHFDHHGITKTWPEHSEEGTYGDYIFVLLGPKNN
ncbi:MAG: class I SAM-dependent methyltransferase [Nanoarchaeota archaeon]|nr:class I SAM-dependent methyltransferase [Nanoarchaeota archaeon]